MTFFHILKSYLVGNRRYTIFIFPSLRSNLHHNWGAASSGLWTVERFSYTTAYHPDDKEVYEWVSLRQNIRDLPKVLRTAASFDLEEDFFACELGGAVLLE
jgi:hypothetical protein